jgi:hypothetical protein
MMAVRANESFGLRRSDAPFDYVPAARCVSPAPPLLVHNDTADVRACTALCAGTRGCVAAQLNYAWTDYMACNASDDSDPLATDKSSSRLRDRRRAALNLASSPTCLRQPQCELHAHCLERTRAPYPVRSDVMHRQGPVWPPGATPSGVRWRANATLVIVSYKMSLAWLRTLPGRLLDVVVYHKADLGQPNSTYRPMTPEYVLGHLRQQELCGWPAAPNWRQLVERSTPSEAQRSWGAEKRYGPARARGEGEGEGEAAAAVAAAAAAAEAEEESRYEAGGYHGTMGAGATSPPVGSVGGVSQSSGVVGNAGATRDREAHGHGHALGFGRRLALTNRGGGGGGGGGGGVASKAASNPLVSRASGHAQARSTAAAYRAAHSYITQASLVSHSVSTQRVHYPSRDLKTCPSRCVCGRRALADRPWLQYFARLPNYGRMVASPHGGSREPFGYLQFILDFWDNLPPVVIFSQDDCLGRGCGWGNAVPQLAPRLAKWESEWGIGMRPTQRSCLCKFVREETFKSKGYFWWRWMSFLEERLFGVRLQNRSAAIEWPQDATFAIGRSVITSQPKWLYEYLSRLTTVERACMGTAGTIMWAHSIERLWFEIFDERTHKHARPVVGKFDSRGACLLGARRR